MKEKKFNIGAFLSNNMAWVILFVLMLFFGFYSDNFFSIGNIMNLISQNAYLLIAGTGITFIMMSGEMDLSVGYVISTIGVVGAKLLVDAQWPVAAVIVVMLLLGIVIAVFNTFLSRLLKLPRMVVTIGTMTIFQGLTFIISKSKTISNFPQAFKYLGQGTILGRVPISLLFVLVAFFSMSFVLNKTYFGRYVYALGGNQEAARLAGINIRKMQYSIAVIEGFFIGLSVILLISRLGSTQSTLGPGTEFTVLTGVFLGGVSIRGGEGKLSGVYAGIMCISLLTNGMQLAGINIYYQYLVRGAIMLFAIGFDVFQLNRKNQSKKLAADAAKAARKEK